MAAANSQKKKLKAKQLQPRKTAQVFMGNGKMNYIVKQEILYLNLLIPNKKTNKYGFTLVVKKSNHNPSEWRRRIPQIEWLDGDKQEIEYLHGFVYFRYECDDIQNIKITNDLNQELSDRKLKKISQIDDATVYYEIQDDNNFVITGIKIHQTVEHGAIYEGEDLQEFLSRDFYGEINTDLSNFIYKYDNATAYRYPYLHVSGISELSLKVLINVLKRHNFLTTKVYKNPANTDTDYLLRLPYEDNVLCTKPSEETISVIIEEFKELNISESKERVDNLYLAKRFNDVNKMLEGQRKEIAAIQHTISDLFEMQMIAITEQLKNQTDVFFKQILSSSQINPEEREKQIRQEYEEREKQIIQDHKEQIQAYDEESRGVDRTQGVFDHPKLLILGNFNKLSENTIRAMVENVSREILVVRTGNVPNKKVKVVLEYEPNTDDLQAFINGSFDYVIEAPHAHSLPLVGETGLYNYAFKKNIETIIYPAAKMTGNSGMSKTELEQKLREVFTHWKQRQQEKERQCKSEFE